MDELKLVYVHKIDSNSLGQFTYELFFSENAIDIDDPSWASIPLNVYSNPPEEKYITKMVEIRTELDLVVPVCIDDDNELMVAGLSYQDLTDGIIPIAYEKEYNIDLNERIVIHFGEDYDLFFSMLENRKYKILGE